MTRSENEYDGLLLVDKPGLVEAIAPEAIPDSPIQDSDTTDKHPQPDERLLTSHDVVQLARRWSHQRRIGHTGTLDPMASGLLVLCMGRATRLVEYYQGHDKQYYAEVQLGTSTDTYDALGQATARADVPALTDAAIDQALNQFRGDILQRPPAFSALKQGGESLHRKARRGETVQIDARPITVHALDLVDWIAPDRLCLRVTASAGTYIRSLAHDIGQALGTEAHLARLRRERAGAFDVAQAHGLDEIRSAAEAGRLADLLLSPGDGLDLPEVVLTDAQMKQLGFGQVTLIADSLGPVRKSDCKEEVRWQVDQLAQGRDPAGQFAGILRCVGPSDAPETGFFWTAKKWFAANQ